MVNDTRDGRWHHSEQPPMGLVKVQAIAMSQRLDRSSYSYNIRGYRATIFRWDGKRFEQVKCPHAHKKRPRAVDCGRREAARRNREGQQAVPDRGTLDK